MLGYLGRVTVETGEAIVQPKHYRLVLVAREQAVGVFANIRVLRRGAALIGFDVLVRVLLDLDVVDAGDFIADVDALSGTGIKVKGQVGVVS